VRRGTPALWRTLFMLLVFAILLTAIASRVPKRLNDFDQSFYLTIAYDLQRHATFSNGIFDNVDSISQVPPPGMFFVPVYPALVLLAMQADARFATAVDCAERANHGKADGASCDIYARPINALHAAFLTLGIFAIGMTAALVTGAPWAFFAAAAFATAGLIFEAELFSYIMTESVSFGLFSLMGLLLVRALKDGRAESWGVLGLALGVLTLTKPSFAILAPVTGAVLCIAWLMTRPRRASALLVRAGLLALGFVLVVGPWIARNGIVIGKWGLTEEYGAAALVERFAYNEMALREGLLAFPYCVPVIGPPLIAALAGPDAMRRFEWSERGGFFDAGRARRNALIADHGKLDPVFRNVLADEISRTGVRHLLVSIPLAWCGSWVSGAWSLLMLPLFVAGCLLAGRRYPLLLYYAAPAVLMISLHAIVANHYSRYNLGMIGPMAVAACALAARLKKPSHQPAIRHS
jgi:hypothetical protein